MRVFLFSLLACLTLSGGAWAVDAQDLFKTRCSACHQNAQGLVQEKLKIDDGVLRSRATGQDMRQFLPGHYGHPNPEETVALYDHLHTLAKACPIDQDQGLGGFQVRCAICHVSAQELAREKLVRHGNVVRGRYSGRELRSFLRGHGRICAGELDYYVQLLTGLAPTR